MLDLVGTKDEISNISAEISPIYRISVPIDTISAFDNRLKEKPPKNREKQRYIVDISVLDRYFSRYFSTEGHARVEVFCFNLSTIYRRYIRYISDISVCCVWG